MNYNFSRLVAFELWLACYTQEEIAVVVNISQREVGRTLDDMAGLPKGLKVAADHLVDFTPPILRKIFYPE